MDILTGRQVLASRRSRARASPNRRRRGAVLLSLALTLVAGAGAWGLFVRLDAPGTHDAGRRAIPGGSLIVSQFWPEVMAHAMPGMNVPDEVRPGYRRIALEVTIEATDGRPLVFRAQTLSLTARGMAPTRPVRAQPDQAVIPAGTALSARIVYDVPADAADLALLVEGAEVPLIPANLDGHPDDAVDDRAHAEGP